MFKGTLRQAIICLRPPPLLGFCLGWSSNFVGSESGQIESVKLLLNILQHNSTPHPHPVTHCLYLLYFDTVKGGMGGGGGELERRLEGQ
jgi:hypothetical protein